MKIAKPTQEFYFMPKCFVCLLHNKRGILALVHSRSSSIQVSSVPQDIHKKYKLEQACKSAHRTTAVSMQSLWQDVLITWRPRSSCSHSHWWETLCLLHLFSGIQSQGQTGAPWESAHDRPPIPVHRMSHKFSPQGGTYQAQQIPSL